MPTDRKQIAFNRKALHDYHIEQRLEAGLVLFGWEVKSIRAGRAQLKDSYVVIQRGEAWLLNCHIPALSNVPEYTKAEPERSRKLLLHQKELSQLAGKVSREGYTLIPLALYWKRNRVKLEFGLAKGKKQHDKRESIKRKEWAREKQRLEKQKRIR